MDWEASDGFLTCGICRKSDGIVRIAASNAEEAPLSGASSPLSAAHNPEVVGSSPSPATRSVTVVDTISTTVIFYFPLVLGAYRMKMGVFRSFSAEN